jgi:hypothetical protein
MPGLRLWGATGLGLVALVVSLGFWDVERDGGPVFCLFHNVTGVACPACGLTRAVSLAARGEIGRALALHPAGGAWLVWGLRLATGRRWFAGWELPATLATVSALVVLWLIRLALGTLPS